MNDGPELPPLEGPKVKGVVVAGDWGKAPGIVAGEDGCEPNAKGFDGTDVEGALKEKDGADCPKGVEGAAEVGVDCDGAPNGFACGVEDVAPKVKGEEVLPED